MTLITLGLILLYAHAHTHARTHMQIKKNAAAIVLKILLQGWPLGQVVEFMHFPSAAWGFAGLDPGHRHGTAHQAMLGWHPT